MSNQPDKIEQCDQLTQELARLRAKLVEISKYLDNHADVEDRDDGTVEANFAMRMQRDLGL